MRATSKHTVVGVLLRGHPRVLIDASPSTHRRRNPGRPRSDAPYYLILKIRLTPTPNTITFAPSLFTPE
jgi:hypothetical protein